MGDSVFFKKNGRSGFMSLDDGICRSKNYLNLPDNTSTKATVTFLCNLFYSDKNITHHKNMTRGDKEKGVNV